MFISFHQRKETNQRNAAQEGEGLDFKKATSRIFEIINILSLLRITLTCRQSRREGEIFCESNAFIHACNPIAAVLWLKSSRFYRLIRLHHQIICGEVLCQAFFQESGNRAPRASPINQNLKNYIPSPLRAGGVRELSRLAKRTIGKSLWFFLVTRRRLELRTPWLKVKCSTVWASGSFFRLPKYYTTT